MKAGVKKERWGILRAKEESNAGVKVREEGRQGRELGQQTKATCSEGQSNFIE